MFLETLACKKIGNTRFINSNTSYECDSNTYRDYSLKMVLPILIIWAIIIPSLLFLLMKKNSLKFNKKIEAFEQDL